MSSHDREIDQTLSALRNVQTPPGLEQHILQTLDRELSSHPAAHQRTPTHRAWSRLTSRLAGRLSPAILPTRLVLGAACTLLLATLATVLLYHRAPSHYAGTAQELNTPSPIPAALQATNTTPSYQPLPTSTPRRITARHGHASIPAHTAQITHVALPSSPGPLTEQERLLQQIARAGNPVQIAMLNPDLRARQEAENDAEFRQFFTANKSQNP